MATVTIPDSTYQRLKEVAAAMQLPLDKFLDRVAAGGSGVVSGKPQVIQSGTPEWTEAFNEWIASHPAHNFVVDDGRDAIYGDERG
jgi:hypothetical protein